VESTRRSRSSGDAGFTILELVFVVSLSAVLAGVAIPLTGDALDAARTSAAARYLAGQIASNRMDAVNRSRAVALQFEPSIPDYRVARYVDGNGNGVRTREIAAGIDRTVAEGVSLAALFPHVEVSLTDPADSSSSAGSALLSFTPLGTSSSRSVYVRGRDGSQYAVRVLGATGRTRVLRYVPATRAWLEVL